MYSMQFYPRQFNLSLSLFHMVLILESIVFFIIVIAPVQSVVFPVTNYFLLLFSTIIL